MPSRPRISITEIREAVERLIYYLDGVKQRPTSVDGILRPITEIPENHIYPNYALANSRQDDSDYPKVSLSVDGGTHSQGIAHEIGQRIGFDIIFIFKDLENPGETSQVHLLVEKCIDDFMFAVEHTPRLFDTPGVLSIDIDDWTTDSGVAFPEGVCMFKLVVSLRE